MTLPSWASGTRARTALMLAIAAVVIALVSGSQLYFNWVAAGYEASFPQLAGSKLIEWGLWAGYVPVIISLERRFGFTVRPIPVAASVHILSAVAFFAVMNAVLTGMTLVVDPVAQQSSFAAAYWGRAGAKLVSALVIYSAILGVYWLLRLREEHHREASERARLSADLSEARLINLKSQIHPHFLFNTLHMVAGLVREGDRQAAVETIEQLSDLLRRAMRDLDQHEVPLHEEIEFLDRYLSIQKLRFGERLEVDVRVDENVRNAAVPGLILQPLVENAIRHGLDLDRRGGQVLVAAGLSDGELSLSVEDNGEGLGPGPLREGLGMGTTRRRLAQLFGDSATLTVSESPMGGVCALIRLPFRPLTSARRREEKVHG